MENMIEIRGDDSGLKARLAAAALAIGSFADEVPKIADSVPKKGPPITHKTRTIPRGMNHRCPCLSGKKSRNCCKA